jgi:CheY-like chemotaxis protein
LVVTDTCAASRFGIGHEVLERLRRVRPDVKVILTTAYSQEQAMNTVDWESAWALIRKPYPTTDLVKVLQDALAA